MRYAAVVVMMLAAAAAFAEWQHSEKENLMEGTASRTAILRAEAYEGTLSTPALVIRKTQDGYDVYVHWGGYSMDRDITGVAYRIGEQHSYVIAGVSTNREATFLRDWQGVIAQFRDGDGKELVIEARRATGVMSVAKFDLTGVTEALRVIDGEEQ